MINNSYRLPLVQNFPNCSQVQFPSILLAISRFATTEGGKTVDWQSENDVPFSTPVPSLLSSRKLGETLQAPVPEKTISANRGLNPANQGIKFVLRLDCVPQNTISTIPGI